MIERLIILTEDTRAIWFILVIYTFAVRSDKLFLKQKMNNGPYEESKECGAGNGQDDP